MQEYNHLLADHPSDPMYIFLLARLQSVEKQQASYHSLIKNHPSSPWGYYGKATIAAKNTDFNQAQQLFTHAIQLQSSIPQFYLDLVGSPLH